jgi:hypothetical protein
VHEIADLPHQRLMAIDERLGGGSIVVKARRRHRLLDLADGLLGGGDARFQLLDLRAARLLGARLPPRLRIGSLPLIALPRLPCPPRQPLEACPEEACPEGARPCWCHRNSV